MSRVLRQSVTLEGGRAHGRVVEVDPLKRIHVEIVDSYPFTYGPGEWSFGLNVEPVTVERVEFDTYERVDESTFRLRECDPRVVEDMEIVERPVEAWLKGRGV